MAIVASGAAVAVGVGAGVGVGVGVGIGVGVGVGVGGAVGRGVGFGVGLGVGAGVCVGAGVGVGGACTTSVPIASGGVAALHVVGGGDGAMLQAAIVYVPGAVDGGTVTAPEKSPGCGVLEGESVPIWTAGLDAL